MQSLFKRIGNYNVELWLTIVGILILIAGIVVQRLFLAGNESPDLHFLGVPLDDVYIHTQFAKNLLHGYGYSFQAEQIVTADTSPLWVAMIAACGLLTSRLELVAITLSMLTYLALGPGVYRVARDLFGMRESYARVAGIATIISSRLVWSGMSGMETSLAALLMLLVVEEHVRSRKRNCLRAREAILLALALLVRPEFMFVALVLVVDWLIAAIRGRANISAAPISILLTTTISSPVFLLPLITRNSIFSHSSVVQGAGISFIPNVTYLWFAAKVLASNNLILFLLFTIGIWFLWRKPEFFLLILIATGLPILQSFVAPQFRHHGRYFFSVFPLIILCAVAAWQEMELLIRPKNFIVNAVVALIALAGVIETGRWSLIEAESVRNINDQHLAVVGWLRQNMRATDTLAMDDVGAIGYFLNKPVIDLTGLMTPSLWSVEHDQDSIWHEARKMGANLFVIYRRLNPPFFEDHQDSLVLVREFRVRLPLASAADTVMSIYRIKEQHS